MSGYWLLKTEPGDYNFADLERDVSTIWDGVRNPAALKHMRAMQPGDRALIYHTGNERKIVGCAEITSHPYTDPEATPESERKNASPVVVDLRVSRRLPHSVPLATIKSDPFFADFALVRQGRLSVVPVTPAQWTRLLALAEEPS